MEAVAELKVVAAAVVVNWEVAAARDAEVVVVEKLEVGEAVRAEAAPPMWGIFHRSSDPERECVLPVAGAWRNRRRNS